MFMWARKTYLHLLSHLHIHTSGVECPRPTGVQVSSVIMVKNLHIVDAVRLQKHTQINFMMDIFYILSPVHLPDCPHLDWQSVAQSRPKNKNTFCLSLKGPLTGRLEMKRHCITYPWRQPDTCADLSLLPVIPELSVISHALSFTHQNKDTPTVKLTHTHMGTYSPSVPLLLLWVCSLEHATFPRATGIATTTWGRGNVRIPGKTQNEAGCKRGEGKTVSQGLFSFSSRCCCCIDCNYDSLHLLSLSV